MDNYRGGDVYLVHYIYATKMWVRMLGKKGDSLAVIVPARALTALGWEQGDYLYLRMVSNDELIVKRFNPAHVPDALKESIDPLPTIEYGKSN